MYAALAVGGGLVPWNGSSRSTALARDIFPYRVFTVADETPVACGPGEAFYATDLLPANMPLEVYRRDAQGWLAIRPPTRSFSWIPARKLHISADDRIATVITDDAVAWVGSHVETVSDHRWQVRLDRGERLAILGHRQLVDDKRGTSETWYQVEPPAGEFRWVHSGDVSRHSNNAPDQAADASTSSSEPAGVGLSAQARDSAAHDGRAARDARDGRDSRNAASRIEPAQFRADPLRGPSLRNEPPVADWSPRSRPRSSADDRLDGGFGPNGMQGGPAASGFGNASGFGGFAGGRALAGGSVAGGSVAGGSVAGGSVAGGSVAGGSVAGGSTAMVDTAPLPITGPAVTSELEDLTLQLNAVAQREPNLWNLGPLRARAEALIESGSNALERGKARLMLEKIEEFEQLQQRHIRAERGLPPDEPSSPRASTASANSNQPAGFDFVSAGVGRLANSAANPLANSAANPTMNANVAASQGGIGGAAAGPRIEPRFDGTGWLLPVHSTKRVAPPYALLDDNGKVLQYVTPAPGLNLHRYERRRVGLYGQKAQTRSLNAPHLTAHRLVDLERHARKQ
jgi:hypothetical protein